ncbi:MAG TPA: IclR family transcriptional regulator [Gemmatimonadaceae bacterium]|nr:IclR family transcriptional regulator [Gemmatimonadaceae bacterium]
MKREFTSSPPYTGTQAVLRAMAILKAFSDGRVEWSATELARALGLNKTTVFRILSALEREGMVVRTPAGNAYRLGPDAIVLGAQALRSNDLRTVARPELEELARRSGETVTLEVLVGDDVLIVDEITSRYVVGSTSEVGTRWPAHATSTGKVMLAAIRHGASGSDHARHSARSGRLTSLAPRTVGTTRALAGELDRVWRRGYATAIEEIEAGFVAVGAPVRDHEGRVVAAVSAGGPKARLTKERIPEFVALVRASADAVSLRLGYRQPLSPGLQAARAQSPRAVPARLGRRVGGRP